MLSIISIYENEKWNKIVNSFDNHDTVFYLNDYVKAFSLKENCEPILIYFDNGKTKGINVVVKKDISKLKIFENKLEPNTYFDISTPYGYGGFLIEGDEISKVFREYDKYCLYEGYVSDFVRFSLFNNSINSYTGVIETNIHNIVRNLDISIDDMLMEFEHKVRKNIKKANNYNLKIMIDENGDNLNYFLDIYYDTMKRNHAKLEYYFNKYFFETLHKMKNNFIYFYVFYENKVISTELILYGKKNCYSFLGGTYQKYFNLRANDFLKFEIIKWAKNKGLKNFILGGGHGNDDGIYRYKKSFSPNGIVNYYVGKKIFHKDRYNFLSELAEKLNVYNIKPDKKFFPYYRSY